MLADVIMLNSVNVLKTRFWLGDKEKKKRKDCKALQICHYHNVGRRRSEKQKLIDNDRNF